MLPAATDLPQPRAYDVALLGASGTYGRLAAELLARWAPPGTRIALAGRDPAKLHALLPRLAAPPPAARDAAQPEEPRRPHQLPLVPAADPASASSGTPATDTPGAPPHAATPPAPQPPCGSGAPGPRAACVLVYPHAVDLADPPALHALAAAAAVIASAVRPPGGPGACDALLAACVEAGCCYTDLEPRPAALLHILQRFHAPARAAGVVLAPGCGFDYAVPDAAAALAEAEYRRVHGGAAEVVRLVFSLQPGPQGLLLSTKWLDSLLQLANHQPASRQRPGQPPGTSTHTATRGARGGAHPEGGEQYLHSHCATASSLTQQQHGDGRGQSLPAGHSAAPPPPAAAPAAAPPAAQLLRPRPSLPPPHHGPLLSYCDHLRRWTVSFPVAGAAERLLHAWRHGEHVLGDRPPPPDPEQHPHRNRVQHGPGSAPPCTEQPRQPCCSPLLPEPLLRAPLLDCCITLPLPLPPPPTPLAAMAAVLLAPALLPLLPLLLLLLLLVLLPAACASLLLAACLVPPLLLATRWAPARAVLVRAAPLLSGGRFTRDPAKADQALADLRFVLLVSAEGRGLAVDAQRVLGDGGVQAVAGACGGAGAGAGSGAAGAASALLRKLGARRAGLQEASVQSKDAAGACGVPAGRAVVAWEVAGPAPGQWMALTSACLVLAALRLLAGAGQRRSGPVVEGSGGAGVVDGGDSAGAARAGGVLTPGELLGGAMWCTLESELGVSVRRVG